MLTRVCELRNDVLGEERAEAGARGKRMCILACATFIYQLLVIACAAHRFSDKFFLHDQLIIELHYLYLLLMYLAKPLGLIRASWTPECHLYPASVSCQLRRVLSGPLHPCAPLAWLLSLRSAAPLVIFLNGRADCRHMAVTRWLVQMIPIR